MKLSLLNLIALIIAVSSLQINSHSEISFNEEGTDSLSSSPLLHFSPIRSPSSKSSNETEILSQNFIEQAFFAVSSKLPAIPFLYYLPIYSLNRAKEYFLLI
jgi:hypothetical protein